MNERPKRNSKPRQVYVPEMPKERKPRGITPKKKEKNRNVAMDDNVENKWKIYKDRVKRGLSYLIKEMHNLEVNFEGKSAPERGANPAHEAARKECEERIFKAKQAIVSTLRAIASENADHKRWPQLEEGDENDMIDVDDILCSKCNLEEEDDNDILLCDRAGCLRAYHQKCLDPPLDIANIDPDQDWFCWQCECLDDCIDTISERLETDYWNWEDVFPEVNQSLEEALKEKNTDTINNLVLSDDEEDDDYDPSNEDEDNFEGGEEEDGEDEDEDEDNGNGNYFDEENEDEDEGNEQNEDGSDEGDDEEEEEEDDDDIDEDELKELLVDAQNDIVYENIASNIRKLRERKPKKEVVAVVLEGRNDIGRPMARVKRGVFELGKIIEYEPDEEAPEDVSKGEWKVRFGLTSLEEGDNNGTAENEEKIEDMYYDEEDVQSGLKLYEEYSERIANLTTSENSMQELLESGKIDEANVLDHKRDRKQIDYIQLSLQMFGTLRDDDDLLEEDNNLDDDLIRHKNNKKESSTADNSKKKRKSRVEAENDEYEELDYDNTFLEEVDENLDEEWDEGGGSRKKKRRNKKNNENTEKKKRSSKKRRDADEGEGEEREESEEEQQKKKRKKRSNHDDDGDNVNQKKKKNTRQMKEEEPNGSYFEVDTDNDNNAEKGSDSVQEVINLVDY